MKAFCFRGGAIKFGRSVPSGALLIAKAPVRQLKRAVEVLARHAYDHVTLLVPGVPEADSEREACGAVITFRHRVERNLDAKKNRGVRVKRLLKSALVLACLASFGACAHTDFYDRRTGKRLAHFEGDMTAMTFRVGADGSVEWAGNINHSTPTLAQGKAATDKITAIGGALAASGIMAVFR